MMRLNRLRLWRTASPTTVTPRTTHRHRARQALMWAILAMASIHLFALVGFERLFPGWRDPEYGRKIAVVNRLQRSPERPLVLLLGSSRVAMGIRPSVLEGDSELAKFCAAHNIPQPAFANASLIGSGPVMQLMMFRRLLADGVKPALVISEVWSPFYGESAELQEERRIDLVRLRPEELPWLRSYYSEPERIDRIETMLRLVPWVYHRANLMTEFAPWVLPNLARRDANWRQMDYLGWVPGLKPAKDEAERLKLHGVADQYYRKVLEDWQPGERPLRAQRELLELCQTHKIPVLLIQLPESTILHHWTSPTTETRFGQQLTEWQRTFNCRVLDFRTAVDGSLLPDGIHLTPDASSQFTAIWAQRVMETMPEILMSSQSSAGGSR